MQHSKGRLRAAFLLRRSKPKDRGNEAVEKVAAVQQTTWKLKLLMNFIFAKIPDRFAGDIFTKAYTGWATICFMIFEIIRGCASSKC